MILCSEFEKPALMVEEVQNNIVIKPWFLYKSGFIHLNLKPDLSSGKNQVFTTLAFYA